MLLRRDAGQRLEPVGIVRRAVLDGPFLHGLRNRIRNGRVQLIPLIDGLFQLPVYVLWKTLPHHLVVKYILSENSGDVQYLAHTFTPYAIPAGQRRKFIIPAL